MKISMIFCLLIVSISKADPVVEVRSFNGKTVLEKSNEPFVWLGKPLGPIDSAKRDRFFNDADLVAEVAKFDELEKNTFFYRLRAFASERVSASYPAISKEKIIRASSLIKRDRL